MEMKKLCFRTYSFFGIIFQGGFGNPPPPPPQQQPQMGGGDPFGPGSNNFGRNFAPNQDIGPTSKFLSKISVKDFITIFFRF